MNDAKLSGKLAFTKEANEIVHSRFKTANIKEDSPGRTTSGGDYFCYLSLGITDFKTAIELNIFTEFQRYRFICRIGIYLNLDIVFH